MKGPSRLPRKIIEKAKKNANLTGKGRFIAWWPREGMFIDYPDTKATRVQIHASLIYATVSWDGFVEKVKR